MNSRFRKTLEVIFIVLIICFSIAVFMLRDKIKSVNDLSYFGVFYLCFLANSTILLPAPSLMVVASCALIMNPLLVAIFAASGSSLGEVVGYAFGNASKDISYKFQKTIDRINLIIHSPLLLIFIFAVLPVPFFDLVGIYSGGAKVNIVKFFLACFAGKFLKMLLFTRFFDIINFTLSYIHYLGGVK